MVLGTYYLTYSEYEESDLEGMDREKVRPHVFRTARGGPALLRARHGQAARSGGVPRAGPVRAATCSPPSGRIIFNDRIERALEEALGEEFDRETYRFINKTLKKRDVTSFVDELIGTYGAPAIALVLDAFKDLGFHCDAGGRDDLQERRPRAAEQGEDPPEVRERRSRSCRSSTSWASSRARTGTGW